MTSSLQMPTILRIAVLALAAAASAHAQGRGTLPRVLSESLDGRDTFRLYCAPCHGPMGRADGPVVPALKAPPSDLSRLSQRSGGAFPGDRVRAIVNGTSQPVAAHGSTDMPIWGQTFRAFETDARARVRIANLIEHIETLQEPTSGSNDPGAQLYRTYCASCHGISGRGNGPVASQLRMRPPDLTTFTTRSGGVFPGERVREIVDGRGIAAHGDREMPVWGDAFQAGKPGANQQEVQARIEAIVRYLRAIQARNAE